MNEILSDPDNIFSLCFGKRNSKIFAKKAMPKKVKID
jgi:hypothetical protein